jgi:IS30 family transposase
MGKRYRHISLEERDRIAEMKSLGHTVTEIAEELRRSKGTLSRELRRNATPAYKVYLSHRAHERAVITLPQRGSVMTLQSGFLATMDDKSKCTTLCFEGEAIPQDVLETLGGDIQRGL